MTNGDLTSLPAPTFAGGTTAITATSVVGAPRREYAVREPIWQRIAAELGR